MRSMHPEPHPPRIFKLLHVGKELQWWFSSIRFQRTREFVDKPFLHPKYLQTAEGSEKFAPLYTVDLAVPMRRKTMLLVAESDLLYMGEYWRKVTEDPKCGCYLSVKVLASDHHVQGANNPPFPTAIYHPRDNMLLEVKLDSVKYDVF
jgi:hypothetical protein